MSSDLLYETSRYKLMQDNLKYTSGVMQEWEYIVQKGVGGVIICALLDNQKIILVKEYRGAVRDYVLRMPAGLVEKGETPEQAASRELEEEIGQRPTKTKVIGKLKPRGGSFRGVPGYIVLAQNLKRGTMQREPGEEDMLVRAVSMEQAFQLALKGKIEDLETTYAILITHHYLQSNV